MGGLKSLVKEAKRGGRKLEKETKRVIKSPEKILFPDASFNLEVNKKILKEAGRAIPDIPEEEASDDVSLAEEALAPVPVEKTVARKQRQLRRRKGLSSTLLATGGKTGIVTRPSLLS